MPFNAVAYERMRTATTVGAVVHYRERTVSTMDDARDGARGAERWGDAYVAGEQSAGRGRRGRSWISTAAVGLYVTFHLRPQSAESAPLLSIAGGLAAADAVSEISGLSTQLKWPNDVLVRGRKLAGVLAEAQHGERLDVLLGVGINVRATRELPLEVAQVATSIERAGAPPPALESLLAALSAALERWAARADDDPAALIEEWSSRLVTIGQRVRFSTPSGEVEGEAIGVSERGELVLRFEDGTTEAYSAGDVTTV